MLKDECIHIEYHNASDYIDRISELQKSLSIEELQTARRFHFQELQSDYIIAHGLLRHVLGNYLSVYPNKVIFGKDINGKPLIINTDIQFNLSHSQSHILIGISPKNPIGVDIEHIQPGIDFKSIASIYYTASEKDFIFRKNSFQQLKAFYEIWVGKEAVLKGIGVGLSVPLDSFSAIPKEKNTMLTHCSALCPESLADWRVCQIRINNQPVAAALAMMGIPSLHLSTNFDSML